MAVIRVALLYAQTETALGIQVGAVDNCQLFPISLIDHNLQKARMQCKASARGRPVKAVLLIAGLGTRLRPLTDSVPKCLLPINGKPLLGIWFDKLVAAGVSEVLINTHWLADQVTDYIETALPPELKVTVFL